MPEGSFPFRLFAHKKAMRSGERTAKRGEMVYDYFLTAALQASMSSAIFASSQSGWREM